MTTKHHAIPQYYLDMQKQPLNRSSDYFANWRKEFTFVGTDEKLHIRNKLLRKTEFVWRNCPTTRRSASARNFFLLIATSTRFL
jgi:hypothetical protein